jgi:hypothetical protein
MKKTKLNLEELAPESFQPQPETDEVRDGTVQGHALRDTQQFRCTYFCTYSACTGLPC